MLKKIQLVIITFIIFSFSFGIIEKTYASTAPNPTTVTWSKVGNMPVGSVSYNQKIVYGNGIYVYGDGSGVYHSVDLINWTQDSFSGVVELAFEGGKFITTDNFSNLRISTNGINWTSVITNGYIIKDVIWNGNKYVAVGTTFVGGQPSYAAFLQSTDGLSWGASTNNLLAATTITFTGSGYIVTALNVNGTGGGYYYSTDGYNYTLKSPVVQYAEFPIYSNGVWTAYCYDVNYAGGGQAINYMCTSSDGGLSWTKTFTGKPYYQNAPVITGNGFNAVAGCDAACNYWGIFTGTSLDTFVLYQVLNLTSVKALTYDGNRYVIVDSTGFYIGEIPNSPPTISIINTNNIYYNQITSYGIPLSWNSQDTDGNSLTSTININGTQAYTNTDGSSSTAIRANNTTINLMNYSPHTNGTLNTVQIIVSDGRASVNQSINVLINTDIPLQAIKQKNWDSTQVNIVTIVDNTLLVNNSATESILQQLKTLLDSNNIQLNYITTQSGNKAFLEAYLGARVNVILQ
jgi:hypothetical protein